MWVRLNHGPIPSLAAKFDILFCMDKDALCQQIKKAQDRLRWVGLSSDPDYVQLCHEVVESNAEQIEKALESIS